MTALGSYYHDFPRLAQQSGYFFQLYRGKVNWKEIENLNIEEIIENRNFQLLEHNLINVINCNLEREYDLKILDQKFVKLFKLAQLGVDYVSYCEMYLDRCVVLLQEQLITLREEYELLKKDNLKKSEELKKIKKRGRGDNFQCKKCEKVFISEVYLNHHDKRRHSAPNTPKSLDRTFSKGIDCSQQTDDDTKITSSTQTLFLEEKGIPKTSENTDRVNKENNEKIDNLQKELEELKTRLKKTENSLYEKAEAAESSHQPFLNYPGPVFYPPIFPYVPPYITSSPKFYDYTSCHSQIIPDTRQSVPSIITDNMSMEMCQTKTASEASEEKLEENTTNKVVNAKEVQKIVAPKVEKCSEIQKVFQDDGKENEKENINPQIQIDCAFKETIQPVPFPRRQKKFFQNLNQKEEQTLVESFNQPKIDKLVNQSSDLPIFSSNSINFSSTPVKETTEVINKEEEVMDNSEIKFKEKKTVSNESLMSEEMISVERNKKSFLKKFAPRNSRKMSNFRKSLKTSLTNLYDSVSSSSKDSTKIRESTMISTDPLRVLNNKLKQLGVDPEWTGIPKKTLKQKLKALRYRRKHLAEENPMYPVVRQSIENSIFTKLKKYSQKKETSNDPNGNECDKIQASYKPSLENLKDSNSVTAAQKPIMYNVDTDSETESSNLGSPVNVRQEKEIFPPKTAFKDTDSDVHKKGEKAKNEFDLSVFQVKKKCELDVGKVEEKKKEIELFIDELQTDSDFDTDFLDDLETQRKMVEESTDRCTSNDERGSTIHILESSKDLATENQSILRSTPSNTQLNAKKKVLFVDYVEKLKKELQEGGDTKTDDSWSLRSELDL